VTTGRIRKQQHFNAIIGSVSVQNHREHVYGVPSMSGGSARWPMLGSPGSGWFEIRSDMGNGYQSCSIYIADCPAHIWDKVQWGCNERCFSTSLADVAPPRRKGIILYKGNKLSESMHHDKISTEMITQIILTLYQSIYYL